ncbi:MAG: FKBP-type peptidyl-prolyl cis-trans isomerase [Candidatus Acidiferrales bacterium]|jgi:FKBP-type peptidyl-prolyl cis-trans isomerase
MKKQFTIAVATLAAGLMLAGNAQAQQTAAPAASTQPTPAAKPQTPAPKTQSAPAAKSQALPALKTQKEKDSYALGLNIGRGLSKQPVDIDTPSLLRGMKDALAGAKPLLTDAEVDAALNELQTQVHAKQDQQRQQAEEANMKEGAEFLASNKAKEGVVTLPSGLQYKILKEGTGPKPALNDTVVCNYRGTLINGKEFDSSYKRGQPATFPLNRVIKGWTEAVQLMPVGSKWQLFIPPDLAYGSNGAGPDIGPNATLIFEVELISIQGKSQ